LERVPMSRSSPHRVLPQRKRAGSRERTGGGSQRSSRSPGQCGKSAASASWGCQAAAGEDGLRAGEGEDPAAAAGTPGLGRGAHLCVRACVRGW
jgi:hypothetical protein